MTLYTELATVADELLAEFGQAVTIRHRTAGAYDPATGSVTVTTTDETGRAALFDFGLHQSGTSFTAGALIQAGDKQMLLSPVGITAPKPGDHAIAAGVTWNVSAVKETAPAGTVVIYELLLRR